MTLNATAINAGIYPDVIVFRTTGTNRIFSHSKGGWIELRWEEVSVHRHVDDNGKVKVQCIHGERVRRIQVSKSRALQAMAAIAAGDKVA